MVKSFILKPKRVAQPNCELQCDILYNFENLNKTPGTWNSFSKAAELAINFSLQINIFENTAFGHITEMSTNILEENSSWT